MNNTQVKRELVKLGYDITFIQRQQQWLIKNGRYYTKGIIVDKGIYFNNLCLEILENHSIDEDKAVCFGSEPFDMSEWM